MDMIRGLLSAFWSLSEEMAPYLLLGFLAAALLRAFIDESLVRRHLGQRGWIQTIKAAVIGVPLPLCSCGVIPVAASLHRQGGSPGAVTSFTASTPQTGVDSIFATAALLNWPFALIRVVVAFLNGIVAGTLVDRFGGRPAKEPQNDATVPTSSCCANDEPTIESCCGGENAEEPVVSCCCNHEAEAKIESTCCGGAEESPKEESSCCCGGEKTQDSSPVSATGECCGGHETKEPATSCCCSTDPVIESKSCCCEDPEETPVKASCCAGGGDEHEESSCCCGTAESSTDRKPNRAERLVAGFRFGFVTLPADIGKALLIGLILAALVSAFLPSDLGTSTWTHGILAYLSTTLIAVPLYVCSTGSIPMAYALVHAGFSPGAALVFLIAGPATNTATVSALWKMIGARSVVIYLATLIVIAWISGFAIDQLGTKMEFAGGHLHAMESGAWWKTVSAVALYAVLGLSIWKPWKRRPAAHH